MKKWSKGTVQDKLNNTVLSDRLCKDVSNYKQDGIFAVPWPGQPFLGYLVKDLPS